MSKVTITVNKKTLSQVYNQVAMCNDLGFPNFQKGEPINNLMKEIKRSINKKVKHRQWFRPFAPSILEEETKNWFTYDVKSPYMSFAIPFKKEKIKQVQAVVHNNGTARLQTVSKKGNKWYHSFISKFYNKTGVPILLNTSFNDREPICETPKDALKCFLGTEIDYVYFYEQGILVKRKS